jgi:hypothetical protein
VGLLSSVSSASPQDSDDAGTRHRLVRIELAELRPLLIWVACLAFAVVAFSALGRTAMSSPPVTQPHNWILWAQRHPVEEIAFSLLRVIGVALSWYLLGVTTIGALARVVAWGGLVRVADVLTVEPVKTLLQHALGATLAVSAAAAVPGTAVTRTPIVSDTGPGITITAPAVPGAAGVHAVPSTVGGPDVMVPESSLIAASAHHPDGWATLLDGFTQQAPGPSAAEVAAGLPHTEVASQVAVPSLGLPVATDGERGPQRATHTVAPGDHFWSIAQEMVGRDAKELGVMHYWTDLIEANRERLVDPSNPDLLMVDQVLVLPSVRS